MVFPQAEGVIVDRHPHEERLVVCKHACYGGKA